MKERLTTLLAALGALVLFAAMFLRGEGRFDRTEEIPRPTSAERRDHGHYAAFAWLRAENIDARSWRERFDALGDTDLLRSPTGNLLIVTLPASTSLKPEEFLPLNRWVRAGNTLLVLAALADGPEWAQASGGVSAADLGVLTGLEFEPATRRGAAASLRTFAEPRRELLVPNRGHAYFEGVQTAVAFSDAPTRSWRVKVPYDGFVLALAREPDTADEVLWTRPLGAGHVVVSGYGSLFTNRAIGEADNARLFANVIAAHVGRDGAVLFDDLHHGLGGAYDPRQFYADPRLYVTAAILAGLWLVWVLGSTRFITPVSQPPAPREAELVEASGGFFARVLPAPLAARAMLEHSFARLRRGAALEERDEPPWQYLERHPRVAAADLERLREWHAAARASKRVPLVRLHNLLTRIERATT